MDFCSSAMTRFAWAIFRLVMLTNSSDDNGDSGAIVSLMPNPVLLDTSLGRFGAEESPDPDFTPISPQAGITAAQCGMTDNASAFAPSG